MTLSARCQQATWVGQKWSRGEEKKSKNLRTPLEKPGDCRILIRRSGLPTLVEQVTCGTRRKEKRGRFIVVY
jgi:hypothetical protein